MKKQYLWLGLPLALILAILFGFWVTKQQEIKAQQYIEEQMMAKFGVNQELDAYDSDRSVKNYNGIFQGQVEDGIPYAQSPTGELRWKAPVPVEASDTVYEAAYFGDATIQTQSDSEYASFYNQSEDVLKLNIWLNPTDTSKDKTVMVFFHGGSYGWGGTSDPLYDGQNFVQENSDVILVTVGYRTGIMGFLDLSSVEGGEDFPGSGNLGLLDQIESLRWIQQNIRSFGGNPDNVTIFGESAGAGSVSLLPLMEGTKGLFNRVIAQSGSVALTFSKEEAQPLTDMLLEETKAGSMQELMALTTDQLKAVNENLNEYNNFPIRDGRLLPLDLYQAYQTKDLSGIDLMIGTNQDEVRYWINEVGGYYAYQFQLPILFEKNIKRVS